MKLLEIGLERYGAFAGRSINFDSTKGLAVVYGPNEIGKSTLLSGVSDFFYGIPTYSAHGELFGYDAMRLVAHLQMADGAELRLKRRKGRNKTLSDDKGGAYDQDILGHALGATTRERFLELFGLNHATLRAGGEGLLSADGELGRLIVEAGGGLRSMVQRLGALDVYVDGLFSPRRSEKREFYKALAKVEAADRIAKTATTSKDAYLEARNGHAEAAARYKALIEGARALGKRNSELERLVRVQPLLVRLAAAESELEIFIDFAALPPGFHEQLAKANANLAEAETEARRVKNTEARLQERRNRLSIDAEWPKHRDRIAAIAETAIEVRKARQSLNNRKRELTEIDAKLAMLRTLLDVVPESDLAAIAPSNGDLEEVRRLLTEAVERRADMSAQAKSAANLEDELATLKETIESARSAGRDRPFGIDPAELSALPQAQSGAAAQGKRLAQDADELNADIARLGFRDLEHMRTMAFPDVETLRAEMDARQRLRREVEAAEARADEARASAETAQSAAHRLEYGAALASAETIQQARRSRDQALAPLIASHRTGQAQAPLAQRENEITALASANSTADDLADRRTSDAERVAALAQQRTRQEEAKLAERQAKEAATRFAAQLKARESTFATTFADATAFESDPGKLLTVAIERTRLIDAAANLHRNLADADTRLSDLEPKRQALGLAESLLNTPPAKQATLVERVKSAIATIKAHDAEHANFIRDVREAAAKETQRAKLEEVLSAYTQAEIVWHSAWANAVAALGLKGEVSLDQAEHVMREWAIARGELSTANQTRRRIAQIDTDIAVLAADVTACASELGLTLAADPVEAAFELKRLSEQQEQQWVAYSELSPELENAKAAVYEADEALTEATRVIVEFRAQMSLAEDCDLVSVIDRLRARDDKHALVHQLRDQISSAGDQIALSDLRQSCADRDIDSLRADQAAVELESQHHEGIVKEAVEAMKEFASALTSFEDPSAVNQAIADRECAASDMHTVTQRWVETIVARDLLVEAIARVRAEHQDPLIARAGELFRMTTKGAFQGIEADIDADGKPVVVGRRPDGRTLGVGKMSDGTRDQLFLAFRLASIEQYGKSGEPIPFIADDILVHFDDERAAATLQLLAEFGKTNQVLLFTHHQSVRDAATALGDDAVQIIDLNDDANDIGESQAA